MYSGTYFALSRDRYSIVNIFLSMTGHLNNNFEPGRMNLNNLHGSKSSHVWGMPKESMLKF